ncbi:hypothetical protein J6590_094998 [Homalodisca vitripennis]|nr:hypothetical protein J6590_094998 [Homalodisca vitripennis]
MLENSLNQSDGLVYIDGTLPVTCSELCLGGVATSLSLTLQLAGTPCELLAVYRSPNSNLTRFTEAISRHFTDTANNNQLFILAGDINCGILNTNHKSVEGRYFDVLYDKGFVTAVNQVTRPTSQTCIDHFFVKNTLHATIKRAKYNFYQNKIVETAGDARKFWPVVKEVAGSPGGKERFPIEVFCAHGGPAKPQDVKTICEKFNVYFASVRLRLAGKFNPSGPSEVEDADHALNAVFELRPVTHQELFRVDDTALVSNGDTGEEAYDHASLDLMRIKNWFDHNAMGVNVDKTYRSSLRTIEDRGN